MLPNDSSSKSVQGPGTLQRVRRRQQRVTLALTVVVGIALGCAMPPPAAAQTDTTATAERTLPATHSPKSALWRAAAVPGWGQYYNRQYLKIPFVYVGLGGFTAAMLYTNSRYLLYRRAFLYTASIDENRNKTFPPEYADDYAKLLNELGLTPESDLSEDEINSRRDRLEPQFKAQRDNLRRNRDLLFFGTVFWYGLTVLDAFVSAHLLDFDVSEDLTVTLFPHPTATGLTATLRWGF